MPDDSERADGDLCLSCATELGADGKVRTLSAAVVGELNYIAEVIEDGRLPPDMAASAVRATADTLAIVAEGLAAASGPLNPKENPHA